MEKLKDFFYDKNDIVVALVIILLAGLLIAWRVSVIMDYPAVMAAELEKEQQEQEQQEQQQQDDDQTAGDPNQSDDGSGTGDKPNANANVGQSSGTDTPVTPPASTGDGSGNSGATGGTAANKSSVTVTIPSGSSGDKIAQILVDAGVVSSKADFNSAVTAAKAETRLKAGTFTIPANASVSDVVSIISK